MGIEYIYFLVFAISLILGILLNRFFLNRKKKFLVKKANKEAIRWASQSKPVFGGITFYSVFILAIITFLFISGFETAVTKEFLSLIIVVTLAFLMGLADDLIGTPPSFKFIVQFLVATILIFSDIYIRVSPIEFVNYTITVIWVIGIMNSINMLDNMDSITNLTSLSIIGGTVFFSLISMPIEYNLTLFVSIAIVGGMLSFLIYNWNPAKMYMGDSGSQFLGTFLAFIGIIYFWNAIPISESSYGYNSRQFLIVALAFIVPITDTTTVTINRLLKKKSPFVGGRDHTTHHLSYLGLSERWVATTLFTLSIVGNTLAYIVLSSSNWTYSMVWIYAIFPFTVFISLYSITKITKPK